MSTFRALYWEEHIGGNQYRLRIRNNQPKNNRQWFVFNRRSRTIRAWANRGYVISNQQGYAFRIGVAATVRPYKNEIYQKSAFYGGSRRNIRNNGQKCLDVHGGVNRHRRHVIFWNCHNGLNQAWYIDTKMPKPLPTPPRPVRPPKPVRQPEGPFKPVPIPPRPAKKPTKIVPPEFSPNVPTFRPSRPSRLRYTFTWHDMVRFYKKESKGTGIRWNGRRFGGTRPTFPYMVDYFVRVISRRPSATRQAWLRKIVRCIIRRDPVNNRLLRNWVQQAIKGRKDRNYRIPACVKRLWSGRISQNPNYHDLASLVRFAIYNKRITYKGLYTFIWSVLNEEHPASKKGHTDFWKKFAGIKGQYVSGLRTNHKFVIINAQKKVVVGNTLQQFNKYSQRNYYFYDGEMKAIRWIGNSRLHFGVVGGVRNGSRVRLVRNRGKTVRRQDMFVYDTVDMKFHSWTNKDLCITFRNPSRNGESMVLARCHSGRSTQQELWVKYFEYDNNNGFKPWRIFTMRNRAQRRLVLRVSRDGSLLLPSQTYVKVRYDSSGFDSDKFYWDPNTKCLRNHKWRQGCIGSVGQGCATQMISMGAQGDTGNSCAATRWDGSFLSVNGKYAQPQMGQTSEVNNFVSLNDMSGETVQQWTIKYTNQMANKRGPSMKTEKDPEDPNWGWRGGNQFYLIGSNGQKVIARQTNNREGTVSFHSGNPRVAGGMFQFDRRTKTIRPVNNRAFSLAAKRISNNKYRLIIQRTQRSSAELFHKLGQRGMVLMASNKNYVWKQEGNQISIVPGTGSSSMSHTRRNGFWFQAQ